MKKKKISGHFLLQMLFFIPILFLIFTFSINFFSLLFAKIDNKKEEAVISATINSVNSDISSGKFNLSSNIHEFLAKKFPNYKIEYKNSILRIFNEKINIIYIFDMKNMKFVLQEDGGKK